MFQGLKLKAARFTGSISEQEYSVEKEILDLKSKARIAYQNYQNGIEGLDCGKQMAETIRPHLRTVANTFNIVWARLEEIDPSCPKGKRL